MAQIEELVFSDNTEQEERVAGEEISENNKNGGVISNLISALSPVAKAEDHVSSTSEEKSGGVFSNLISGILLQSEDENDQEKKENIGEGNIHEQLDKEEEGGIVGGFVDNLVAHLPNSPLADDAAPATEEAFILIHSIVHD